MSDSDDDRTQINMRVSRAKKDEWDSALEENDTLTALIRRSVDRELNDEYVHTSVIDELQAPKGDNTSDDSELVNEVGELRDTVNRLSNQIDTLQSTQQHSNNTNEGSEKSVEEIAIEAIEYLPTHPRDTPLEATGTDLSDRKLIQSLIETSRQSDHKTLDGRAEAVAAQLNKPVWRVRESLNHLEHNTTERVKSTILDDGRHWMRL